MRLTLKILGFALAAGLLLYGLTRVAMHPGPEPKDPAPDGLPLVELPVTGTDNDLLAVILSGDGGWADLDRDFGRAFQQRGVATVGFDCLKYFWKPRQPAEVAADLQSALHHYLGAWSKRRLLLVGFSFGAGWLPFVVNRLPDDLRERVSLVVLLVPADDANLEIKVGDWLGDSVRPGALEVLPEAERLRPRCCACMGWTRPTSRSAPGSRPPTSESWEGRAVITSTTIMRQSRTPY